VNSTENVMQIYFLKKRIDISYFVPYVAVSIKKLV